MSRTCHIWELESTRSSGMLKHLPLPLIHKLFEHLPHSLFYTAFHWLSFYCCKPDGLHCPHGWLLENVAFQFHDLCLYSAIGSNGYSLEFIIPQNCSPPKSLHSVFSLSGPHPLPSDSALTTTTGPWLNQNLQSVGLSTLSLFIELFSALPSLFNVESWFHLSSQALFYTLNILSPLFFCYIHGSKPIQPTTCSLQGNVFAARGILGKRVQ